MKSFPLFVLVIASACGTSESGSLLTTGISAAMSVSTTGSGTTNVTAELFDGSPDQLIFVNLQSGDSLVATDGGQSMTLSESQLVTIIAYGATFPTGSAGDEVTIDFERTIDDGAPASTATLPDPFELDPLAGSASRAADITVTYAPSGTADSMLWEAEGDCIQIADGSATSDSGTITIPASTLLPVAGGSDGSAGGACTVTLSVTRDRPGTLDPHFGDGGQIQGQQVRTATFTSMP